MSRDIGRPPETVTLRRRDLAVKSDGMRLAAQAFLPATPKGVAVLLHGIPSVEPPDPEDEGYPGLARRFAERGWAAVWADLRGARAAPGFFSIEGWVRDVTAIVNAVDKMEEAAGRPVALVGSSAGGAVSVEAVVRGAPVDAVVLLGTPAAWVTFAADPMAGARRITEEAGMPLSPETLADPALWAAEFDGVTTERSIGALRVPSLIVHGTADDVVPVEHAYRLSERAPAAELVVLPGAPHYLRRHPGVFELVIDWLERTLP
jgi:alpha-beta hydrolase superfamily lysophospholipase